MTRFVRRATPKDRVVAWSETWHVVAPSGLTVCVVAPIDRLDQETAVDDATGWAWLMHAGYWLHRTSAS
jgi:hypothetical protein